MLGRKQHFINAEHGVSLSGLILVLVVIGLVAVLALKVTPSYLEYRAIKSAIVKAKADGGSVAEMQRSFNKAAEINSISTIRGSDLVISKDSGEPEISFAYEKRIALFGNLSLLIDYQATTDKSGVVAAQTAASAGQ
jgi:Tfp pilus assembly protein PilE